jgi:hypothetical protein
MILLRCRHDREADLRDRDHEADHHVHVHAYLLQ